MEGLEDLKELALHYARGIWKNRWIAVLIAWVLLPIGVLGVDQIQNRYKAETKVYIDSTSVLGPLLEGLAIQSDLDAVVQLMIRQLLSRPNLERAVRLLDLDLTVNTPLEMEKLIDNIAESVKINSPRRSNVYTISYTHTDRNQAKRMVQILLDIFVEDTLGKTGSESDTAIEFLDTQIAKYDVLLREAELRREEFKRKNIGFMPGDGIDYFGQLQEGEKALEIARLLLSESENRLEKIRFQIAELKAGNIRPETVEKTDLELRIEEQERNIDELLLLYTDEHPDVINAKHVLDSLKQRQQAEKTETTPDDQTWFLENPVYQELQIRLAQTEADISTLNTRVLSLEKKQSNLKKQVDIVPKIEADLQRLNRDYEVHKKNYSELVGRREQAKISEDVETGGEQVQFRVIEPPYVPLRADFPNRPLFDVVVLFMALGIGYGVSLLISLFQPVFYNQRDIRNILMTPILGSVQKYDTINVLRKRRRNLAFFSLINFLLLCAAGFLIYLHSKDVVILDKLRNLVL